MMTLSRCNPAALCNGPCYVVAATPVSFRRIDLDWADTPGNDIAGYYIYRDTSSDFTPGDGNLIDTAGESSYSDTTVTAGNTYFYKIVALTGDGVASGE